MQAKWWRDVPRLRVVDVKEEQQQQQEEEGLVPPEEGSSSSSSSSVGAGGGGEGGDCDEWSWDGRWGSARSISTYPLLPTGERHGDPNADIAWLRLYSNRALVAVADGCNWGSRPRQAAHSAIQALKSYLAPRHRISDLQEAAHYLLRAFAEADRKIMEGKQEVWEAGTTTLIAGLLVQIDPDSEPERPAAKHPPSKKEDSHPPAAKKGPSRKLSAAPRSGSRSSPHAPTLDPRARGDKDGRREGRAEEENRRKEPPKARSKRRAKGKEGEREREEKKERERGDRAKGKGEGKGRGKEKEKGEAEDFSRKAEEEEEEEAEEEAAGKERKDKSEQRAAAAAGGGGGGGGAKKQKKQKWGFVCCSVGDCKAFHYSVKRDKVMDITLGNRINVTDVRDPGGRLGPYLEGGVPDLRNLKLSFMPCDPGDLLLLVSDGVHDNFDPQMLGKTPHQLGFSQILPDQNWSDVSCDSAEAELAKDKYRNKKLKKILHAGPLTPKAVTKRLMQHCAATTRLCREYMETNPQARQPDDHRQYPGKMDHTTATCLVIPDCVLDVM